MRVARQKAVRTGGVAGLHPTEEAAITKALRASLQIRKNLTISSTPRTCAEPLSPEKEPGQPALDIAPNFLQSSHCSLKKFPDTVNLSTENVSVACISSVSRDQETPPSSSTTNQMEQSCSPGKKFKCTDQNKSCKSRGHSVKEQSSTFNSSESIFVQQKSSRTFIAQRKFTENFEPIRIKKVFTQANSTPGSDIPKTEDFLSFLCLRDEPLLLC
ncbi:hypothetical protein EMCRGX_G026865 [Ephydatia muelleri]